MNISNWGFIWFLLVMGILSLVSGRYEMSVNIFLTIAILLTIKEKK